MDVTDTHCPSRSLLRFTRLLRLLSGALLVVTPLVVLLGGLMASGRGTLTIPVELDPPYSVGLDAPAASGADGLGRRLDIVDGGIAYVNFPVGEERALFDQAPLVRADVVVSRDDHDTRLASLMVVLGWLLLAWVGLENLRRVVAAAAAGDPFHGRNVVRLRWLAAAVLVYPVLGQVYLWLVDRSLDASTGVTPVLTGTPWWVLVVVGAGLLALAEVFRVGSDLRELERSTV